MSRKPLYAVAVLSCGTAWAQTTTRVSLGPSGAQANGRCFQPAMAQAFVAYYSEASNLVAGDTNSATDLFVSTPTGGLTQRASVSTQGTQGNGGSGVYLDENQPAISPDGRYVAFPSDALNLVADDTNNSTDVYVRDLQSGATSRVSVGAGGQADGRSFTTAGSISADGRYVCFLSEATNLVAGDTNGAADAFLRDRLDATTVRVSVSTSGAQADGYLSECSISADGRFVVFTTNSSNLIAPPDTGIYADVFVRDLALGTTECVSLAASGVPGNGPSAQGQISADGRYVAFYSAASNLVPGDTNALYDVFVRDRQSGTTQRVSVAANGSQATGTGIGSHSPSISGDGRYVGFVSDAVNLVAGDTNGLRDVFVRDRWAPTTVRYSVSTAGAQANGASGRPSISPDGLRVAFSSTATNLVGDDTNGVEDVFVRTTLPPVPSDDECSSPTAIAGTGPFDYDTTGATTSMEGQMVAPCEPSASPGLSKDVWFVWTSTFTGSALLETCSSPGPGLEKIAVYAGGTCPSSLPLASNCFGCLESGLGILLCFPVTAGQAYLVQVGARPGSGSTVTGQFTILDDTPAPAACAPIDDGLADTALGDNDDIDMVWLQRFGEIGESSTVTEISTAWGTPFAMPSQMPPDGSPVKVAIWDDPDDDGNPIDGVLLQVVDGTLVGAGTNQLQTFVLSPPVTASGYFFAGAGVAITPGPDGQYPAPLDPSLTCSGFGRPWLAYRYDGLVDYADLGAHGLLDISHHTYSGKWRLRVACAGNTSFCVPGQDGVIACPCSNPGQPGRGCDNSSATGGALLTVAGDASLAADTIVFTASDEKPTAVSVVLQGTQASSNGAVFGMGVRCAAGSLKRLYTKVASGGSITAPEPGDPAVSAQSAALGDPLSAGATRYYQVYYRDPTVLGGCPQGSTFNLTQGIVLTWM